MIRARLCGHANAYFPLRGTELTFRFSTKDLNPVFEDEFAKSIRDVLSKTETHLASAECTGKSRDTGKLPIPLFFIYGLTLGLVCVLPIF